jgi:hypothetical protein
MATLTSSAVASTVQAKTQTGVNIVKGTYTLTAALALNDVIQMVKVPKGAILHSVVLASDDLDTGGSPAIVLDLGDGSDTDRLIDGSTIAQGGGIVVGPNVKTGAGYAYTADDTIDVLVQVAPATGATSGTITLTVAYTMNNA